MPKVKRPDGARGIADVFQPAVARALAGSRTFKRGEEYASSGCVRGLVSAPSRARATVDGSVPYRVELAINPDGPGWSCSCPMGIDGDFCKHCVAVALVVQRSPDSSPDPDDDLAAFVRGMSAEQIADLVLRLAVDDDSLRDRLLVEAALAKPEWASAIDSFRRSLENAFDSGGYVSYTEAASYCKGILAALERLDELVAGGRFETVIELAEYAAELAERAIGSVDDSDGGMSMVAERIGALHFEACREADLDPVQFAERLFEMELAFETVDVFHGAVETYAEILGDVGVEAYRRLAQVAWEGLPPLTIGDERASYSSDRYRITSIMERLAEMTGDIDAKVAVFAHDLSSAGHYVRIVKAYRDGNRRQDALAWAERGAADFGIGDIRMFDALAEELHHAGRSAEAVDLAWQRFDDSPTAGEYGRLQNHAERAGNWPDVRARAIERIEAAIGTKEHGDATHLVRVRLAEGDADQAWVDAQRHGVVAPIWLTLAAERETKHPDDAIPIYKKDVERLIHAMGNDAYRDAVTRVRQIGTLLTAVGRPEDFPRYVTDIRVRHKPKRNLMKLLDGLSVG